ncbi:hypothetical protein KP509_01G122500 [Ceratopteris richardii]|nr:hypothetical protein KP509_01G122500 [Ceratopteris richardii]KAH7447816.1 hypothetical protein KP509_01G122500 [Ceratopteris richardii]
MSCPLLETTSDILKERLDATHDKVISVEELRTLGKASCWPNPDQPLCTWHGGRRDGDCWKESSLDSVQLDTGLWHTKAEKWKASNPKRSLNQICTEVEANDDIRKHGIPARKPDSDIEQKQAWEVFLVDNLVDKLVLQLNSFSELSTPSHGREENHVLILQEGATSSGLTSKNYEVAKIPGNVTLQHQERTSLTELPESAITAADCNSGTARLKSAFRGSQEKLGLGSRLQMHVTWAPNVYDPPCTSASHTVNGNSRRNRHFKCERRSRHKGKGSSHVDSSKKSQKKPLRRLKYAGEFFQG